MKKIKENAILIKERLKRNEELLINWKWSISKVRDTYGYNVCSCYIDGLKVGRCSGGGYDMRGTSLDEFINVAFKDELKKLDCNKFGGLNKYYEASGGTGLNLMVKILKGLGYKVEYHYNDKHEEKYTISK